MDTDAAASAVRNLDKYQIQGRELRVDFSHVGGKDDAAPQTYHPLPQTQPVNGQGALPQSNPVGPLPMGVELPPGLNCPDAISKTLSTLPPPQLLDILSQMKGLVMGDPQRATELLKQAPQLSYAIFQALLLMGLVDSSLLASVVEQSAAVNPAPIPARSYQPPGQAPPPPFQGYAQGHAPTPPVQQQPYQPPPVPTPAFPPGQEDLIRQLLVLSQSDIDKLAPGERQQIMMIRQQYGGMGGY